MTSITQESLPSTIDDPGSFRDPSGFVFKQEGQLYRQVNLSYASHYDVLMRSGLYDKLVEAGLLIPHTEVEGIQNSRSADHYRTLLPEKILFISYPFEWSFSQLKDAALLTLRIQKMALENGMSLKDASAYNIQFQGASPIFIDTLSFEIYQESKPWTAYRQFCQHFLAPLALMAYRDIRLGRLSEQYIDGLPLDLASKLLPYFTRLNLGLLTHLHIHAGAQIKHADKEINHMEATKLSLASQYGLLDHLYNTIEKLTWQPAGTEWGDYYNSTNYNDAAFQQKKSLVKQYLDISVPKLVWDLGANTGVFSRIASEQGIQTLSFDIDPAAVEKNYRWAKAEKHDHILPLLFDLTNPSPAIGWGNEERQCITQRGQADVVMALALIHHLAISNNLPFEKIRDYFARLGRDLIIEFVPKGDSQVKRLLSTRQDVFPSYDQETFEAAFSETYHIAQRTPLINSERTLYLFRKR